MSQILWGDSPPNRDDVVRLQRIYSQSEKFNIFDDINPEQAEIAIDQGHGIVKCGLQNFGGLITNLAIADFETSEYLEKDYHIPIFKKDDLYTSFCWK